MAMLRPLSSPPLGRLRSPPALLLTALLLAVLPPGTCARGGEPVAVVPPAVQAKILLKALQYDRSLAAGGSRAIVLGVLYRPGDPASEALQARMVEALQSVGAEGVRGRPLRVLSLAYEEQGLRDALAARGVDVLYVSVGLEGALARVRDACRQQGALAVGPLENYARHLGLVVALENNLPRIVVNLPVSREQGAQLDAELLKLARVLR